MSLPVNTFEMQDFATEATEVSLLETGALGEKSVHKISLNDPNTLKTAIAEHEASAKQASRSYLKQRVVAGVSAVVLSIFAAVSFFVFPPSLSMTLPAWIFAGIGATAGLSALPFGFSALTGWSPIKSMKEHKETAQKETQIVDDLKKVEKKMVTETFKKFVQENNKEEEIDETILIDLSNKFDEKQNEKLAQNNNILEVIK